MRTPSYDRKLPDIPNDDIYKNSSTKDDNSELYATVDEVPNNNATNGINTRPELNSLSVPGPSNYDAKNHPYAKAEMKKCTFGFYWNGKFKNIFFKVLYY